MEKYYDTYLVSTEQLVKENNYDGAINKYVEMVQVLKSYFGLDKVTSRNIAQYDFSNGGHGKIMTKRMVISKLHILFLFYYHICCNT